MVKGDLYSLDKLKKADLINMCKVCNLPFFGYKSKTVDILIPCLQEEEIYNNNINEQVDDTNEIGEPM